MEENTLKDIRSQGGAGYECSDYPAWDRQHCIYTKASIQSKSRENETRGRAKHDGAYRNLVNAMSMQPVLIVGVKYNQS